MVCAFLFFFFFPSLLVFPPPPASSSSGLREGSCAALLDRAAGLGYPQNQLSAVIMACLIPERQKELFGIRNDTGE